MIVAYYDHRGLGAPFAEALRDAGHDVFRADHESRAADVFLVDLDHDVYRWMIERYERVVLTPHGAGPHGSPVTSPNIVMRIVTAEGNDPGDDVPTEVVGWPWSDLHELQPSEKPTRILHAPMHPDNDGHVDAVWRAAEARALEAVLAAIPNQVQITYRPGPSTIQESVAACADHDLVIAAPGSIVAAAVAAGTPAVTYRQDLCLHPFNFPYDLAQGVDAVRSALRVEPVLWRRLHVGEPFDVARFVQLVEKAAAA